MKLSRMFKSMCKSGAAATLSPVRSMHELSHVSAQSRAAKLVNQWQPDLQPLNGHLAGEVTDSDNLLRKYFDDVTEGPGMWKWLHYFDVYHHHLQRFVGQKVSLVEVGVYSGGSMPMWREYFGDGCHVHGVDIQPECQIYENEYTTIHIGDQAERGFWRNFRSNVPQVDILIDDGGHTPEQQMVTLEEMLPHVRPGGVFICEDIHGLGNEFISYVGTLIDGLNAQNRTSDKQQVVCECTPFQASIRSVTLYPYVVVIEKSDKPQQHLAAPKHGTQWQPFLG